MEIKQSKNYSKDIKDIKNINIGADEDERTK